MPATASFGGFGVTFTLGDAFSGVADAIMSKFGQLDKETRSVAESVNAGLDSIKAGAAQVAVGLGLLTPVGLGIKYAGEFEAAEIGLRTLLGTEEAAHKAFEAIKADAASTPFGTADLLNANRGLISAGKSAEEARDTVLALGNAIAASGGGTAELNRMAANLQQIGTLGKASSVDIKQFGMAGINIYKLLADATGKSVDAVKEMDVSYELLSFALKKAAGEGGMFEGAMARMSKSINGKFSTIEDGVKFALAAIGEAVMPIVHPVLDFVIELSDKFAAFAKTGLGKTVIAVGIAITALLSLTLIGKGLMLVFSGIGTIIWSALAPMLPFLIIIGAIFGIMTHLAGGVDNLMTVFKGLGAVFMSAGKDGFSMSEELAVALDNIGLLDFVVNMGTWIVRIKEFFSGFIDGMMEVWNVVTTVAGVIWDIITAVVDGFIEMLSWFGIEFDKNTSSLESWAEAGKILAYVIGGVLVVALGALIVSLVSTAIAWIAAFIVPILIIAAVILILWLLWEVISWVWDILVSVAEWMWGFLEPVVNVIVTAFQMMWKVLSYIGQIIWSVLKPAFDVIVEVLGWLWDKLSPVIDFFLWMNSILISMLGPALEMIGDIFAWIWDMLSPIVDGFMWFAEVIWSALKPALDSVAAVLGFIWDLLQPVVEAFKWVFEKIGQGADAVANWAVGTFGSEEDKKLLAQIQSPGNTTAAAGLSDVGAMNAESVAGATPIVTHSNSETVKSFNATFVMDGDELAAKIMDKQDFNDARQ